MLSFRHEEQELEDKLRHFIIEHKEYRHLKNFIIIAIKEKLEREDQEVKEAK